MAIKHSTVKVAGEKLFAVADWNLGHIIDNGTITTAHTTFANQDLRMAASPTFNNLTLTGDLKVDGTDIGITADTDLIKLAINSVTINGTATVNQLNANSDTLGILTAPNAAYSVYLYDYIFPALLAPQFGLYVYTYYYNATGNTNYTGAAGSYRMYIRSDSGYNNTGIVTDLFLQAPLGHATDATGAYSNVSNLYVQSATAPGGATFTNNYGIYITTPTAGTNNYAIYSVGGIVRLGGNLQVNGGNIGIDADTDLISMAANALTINGTVNTITGYKVSGAAAAGTLLRGNGTNFVPTTITFPNSAPSSGFLYMTNLNVVDHTNPDIRFVPPDLILATGINIEIGGLATVYNGIATSGNGIPSIYAAANAVGIIEEYTPRTIYGVPATGQGMYRVSWVAAITTAASTSSVLGGTNGFQVIYTDPADSVVKTSNPATVTNSSANTTATSISGNFNAYCKASTNLQWSFGYTSVGATAMVYDIHVKAERLG